MSCGIQKQIAEYCDESESICSSCGFEMLEKHTSYGDWLECTNEQCGDVIDLSPDRDDWYE